MSPIGKITEYRLKIGEREIGPAMVIKQTINHPLDKLVEGLEEALKKKGKKDLLIIPKSLMDSVSASVYSKLLGEFQDLIAGEGTFIQETDPTDAAIAIKKMGISKEELCLSIYRRYASTHLESDKPLRGQFLSVIADAVNKFWSEDTL